MVIGEEEGGERKGVKETVVVMAMGPERSRQLHNFTMPPLLNWGNQRFLRCMKVDPEDAAAVSSVDDRRRSFVASEIERSPIIEPNRHSYFVKKRRSPNSSSESLKNSPPAKVIRNSNTDGFFGKYNDDDDDRIETVGEKLLFELKTAADKMKVDFFKVGNEEEEEEKNEERMESSGAATAAEERPWNLRTRRSACKAPIKNSNGNGNGKNITIKFDEKKLSNSPVRIEKLTKSSRLRVCNGGEKKERAKFSVSLSRKEIEEDYMEMLGEKPPRRPKKRAKALQKEIDPLFPGMYLTEVTPDMYKVSEFSESGKR